MVFFFLLLSGVSHHLNARLFCIRRLSELNHSPCSTYVCWGMIGVTRKMELTNTKNGGYAQWL
jgi:hypothetical protein